MPARRLGSVTAAGVMSIIFGSLFTLCGLCSVVGVAMQDAMGNNFMAGDNPDQIKMNKDLQDALKRDVPGIQIYQIVNSILGLVLAIGILIGGIGLLNMRKWARTLVITLCLINVLSLIFQTVYQTVFVMPVMTDFFQKVIPAKMPPMPQGGAPNQPDITKIMQTMMTVGAVAGIIFYVLIIVYLLVIVFLLNRAKVRAAFAGQLPPDLDDRHFDEERDRGDYDEERY